MTKAEIRKQIAERKKSFQGLELLSERIVKKFQCLEKQMGGGSASFQTLELFREAKTVGAYIPLPDEVDIRPLFGSAGGGVLPDNSKPKGGANSLGEPKKTFYIPAFDEAAGSYRLAKLTDKLNTGKFGIPEPTEPVFAPEKLDLILVPGVAFDRVGNRIGRGGGFYDRLLPQYLAVRVGVCFDFQCLPELSDKGVEEVPSEPHDYNVDYLVTESQILKFATNS